MDAQKRDSESTKSQKNTINKIVPNIEKEQELLNLRSYNEFSDYLLV